MKAIKFEVTPDHNGTIGIPEAFKHEVSGKKLTVTLSYQEDHTKSPEHHTKGYDQKDSLYDQY